MSDSGSYLRAARRAGARRDAVALLVAARAWEAALEPHEASWKRAGQLGDGELEPADAGLLLLSGAAARAHAAISKRLVFVDANPDGSDRVRLLARVPPAELDNYALSDLAWLRLIGRDWRSIPPAQRGRGRLSSGRARGDRVLRATLAAFESGAPAALRAAILAAGRLEGARSFSVLAYALVLEARRRGIAVGIKKLDF